MECERLQDEDRFNARQAARQRRELVIGIGLILAMFAAGALTRWAGGLLGWWM